MMEIGDKVRVRTVAPVADSNKWMLGAVGMVERCDPEFGGYMVRFLEYPKDEDGKARFFRSNSLEKLFISICATCDKEIMETDYLCSECRLASF